MGKMISYDKQYDILAIHKGFSPDEKFKGNIDIGELILDVSTKGKIIGIEIMNVTEFLKDFTITKEILENLDTADFTVSIKSNRIIIGLVFKAKNIKQELPAKIAVPLEVPMRR